MRTALLCLLFAVCAHGQALYESLLALRSHGSVSLPPSNSVLPVINSNSIASGGTLTVTSGTWSNSPTAYYYQWKRNGTNIPGATSSSYVTEAVAGGVSCHVTASNAAGVATVRAYTGNPRKLFVDGDSLSDGTWTPTLQTMLGTNWNVIEVATSGENLVTMINTATNQIDNNLDVGHSLVFFWEYANQVSGVQGSSTGLETFGLIGTYATNRVNNGAIVLAASIFYRPGGIKNGTQSQIASDMVRDTWTNFASGFVELDLDVLFNNVEANDGVHFTSTVYSNVAYAVASVATNGWRGASGDVTVSLPDYTHLRTHSNPSYVYDPFNPLPASLPYSPTYIRVISGTGWDLGTFLVNSIIDSFPTADGNQRLYNINPVQTTGGLSGGTYYLTNSP